MSQNLTVPPGAANKRLDVYLALAQGITRSQAGKLIRDSAVTVNARPARSSLILKAGDIVSLAEVEPGNRIIEVPDLPILFEDAAVLIIDKPAGIVVHPGAGTHGSSFVSDFARAHSTDPDADRPGIVHRLDRDTSGLLIIAKTPAAKTKLQNAFKARQVHKTYQILVLGRLSPDTAVIKLPIGRNPKKPLEQAIISGGREAVTAYSTLREYLGYSLVEARPLTGRTHQLRVHFAALGHPVIGDTTYGNPKRPLGLKRQFLHAAGISFTSPTGEEVSVQSPLPPELAAVIARLDQGMPS